MKSTLFVISCVLASSFCAIAQDGAPAGTMKKAESAPVAKPEPLDAETQAWVDTLSKRIANPQPLIRDSAIAALERLGKAALPTLDVLATGADKALADAAKKLTEKINRGGGQPGDRGQRGGNLSERVDNLVKDMKLDDQKTQKLKELQKAGMERMRESMDAMRNGELTGEEFREEMKLYREEVGKDLRKFLSEDEAKKVEESLLPNMRGGMGGGERRRGGGEGGQGGGEGGQGGGGRKRPGGN